MHFIIGILLVFRHVSAQDFCPAGGNRCRGGTIWTVDHSLDYQAISGAAVQPHPRALEATKCSLLCQGQQGCDFFFYNKDSRQCLTCPAPCHNVTLTPSAGYRFYKRGNDKVCGRPPDVHRASPSRQFAVPGYDVLYYCTAPYVSHPYSTGRRQCSSSGTWTKTAGDPDPVCKMPCGSPPAFSTVQADRLEGYEGDIASYSCTDTSKRLRYAGRHRCSSSGAWTLIDSTNPLCSMPCGSPPAFSTVQADRSEGYEGDIASYSCTDTSKQLRYTGRYQCSTSGSWTRIYSTDPLCSMYCGSPPAFSTVQADRSDGWEGDIASYTCTNLNAQMRHTGRHQCSSSGAWTLIDSRNPLCSVPPGNVRLVNGMYSNMGRVEVLANGLWGTVCDDNFDNVDATVICRMFGYTSGVANQSAAFGEGYDPIHMDDVNCSGYEVSIFDCAYTSNHNCVHGEDAGVVCS